MLLSFLKVRVIVNNKEIYPLADTRPIIIPVDTSNPKVVVTDGYHCSRPLELVYQEPSYYKFSVVCAIDDLQLACGSFMLVLFYLAGFATDLFFLKLISFVPILIFLFLYYINRRRFIRLVPVR